MSHLYYPAFSSTLGMCFNCRKMCFFEELFKCRTCQKDTCNECDARNTLRIPPDCFRHQCSVCILAYAQGVLALTNGVSQVVPEPCSICAGLHPKKFIYYIPCDSLIGNDEPMLIYPHNDMWNTIHPMRKLRRCIERTLPVFLVCFAHGATTNHSTLPIELMSMILEWFEVARSTVHDAPQIFLRTRFSDVACSRLTMFHCNAYGELSSFC